MRYTEDHLVEQPAIQLMQDELGWEVVNCYDEWTHLRQGSDGQGGRVSALGREGKRDVALTGRLKPALIRLNPDLPMEAIDGAVEGEILNFESVAPCGIAGISCRILNGGGR